MKKIIMTTTATLILAMTGAVNANPQHSYLTDSSNNVVTSGTGLCWITSGDKVYSEKCGDPEPKATPAPAAAPMPAPVVQAPAPVVVRQAVAANIDLSLLFAFDSAQLSRKTQDDLSKFVNSYSLKTVSLVGHADQFGSNLYNQKLGQRRANAVKAYLVSLGVNPAIINPVTSEGKEHPVVECKPKTIACELPNRRVTVRATGEAK